MPLKFFKSGKRNHIVYILAWFWLCQMHLKLDEVTATVTLGVWVLSCSLFLYWSRDYKENPDTTKQCPSNTNRIVQEESNERGRSQPTLSLSSAEDQLSRKKRRFKRLRKRKQNLNASGDRFLTFMKKFYIWSCVLTFSLYFIRNQMDSVNM